MIDARGEADSGHELWRIEQDGGCAARRAELVAHFVRMRYRAEARTGRDMTAWCLSTQTKAARRLGDRWHVLTLMAAGDLMAVRDLEIAHRNDPLRRAAYAMIQEVMLYWAECGRGDMPVAAGEPAARSAAAS